MLPAEARRALDATAVLADGSAESTASAAFHARLGAALLDRGLAPSFAAGVDSTRSADLVRAAALDAAGGSAAAATAATRAVPASADWAAALPVRRVVHAHAAAVVDALPGLAETNADMRSALADLRAPTLPDDGGKVKIARGVTMRAARATEGAVQGERFRADHGGSDVRVAGDLRLGDPTDAPVAWHELPGGAATTVVDLPAPPSGSSAAAGARAAAGAGSAAPSTSTLRLAAGELARAAQGAQATGDLAASAARLRVAASATSFPADRGTLLAAAGELEARAAAAPHDVATAEVAVATGELRPLLDRADADLREGEAWAAWTAFDDVAITIPLRVPAGVDVAQARFARARDSLQLVRDHADALGATTTRDALDDAIGRLDVARADLDRYRIIATHGGIVFPDAVDGTSRLERDLLDVTRRPFDVTGDERIALGARLSDWGSETRDYVHRNYGADSHGLDAGERERVEPIWEEHADWAHLTDARSRLSVATTWLDHVAATPADQLGLDTAVPEAI